jgi:hypothetical protein
LTNRKYTWSNNRQFALLDRYFCTLLWGSWYPNSIVLDLSYDSDHYPLLLHTSIQTVSHVIFRFDAAWLEIEEFYLLVVKRWNGYKLSGDGE